MSGLLATECPRCGKSNGADAYVCGLCSSVLRRAPRPSAGASVRDVTGASITEDAPARARSIASPATSFGEQHDDAHRARRARIEPWFYLALGLVTAPIFAWTPFLQYMGWFLSALVHEMGHAAVAWLCGMPAIPAISLAGHAAAVHQEQSVVLALAIPCVLAAAAWHFLDGRARTTAIALVAVLQPLIAFTDAKELLHLVAGHGAELAFATLCLWKALDGGFTESKTERGLYGTVGWYLLGNNALLCFGLLTSSAARSEYAQNGSFGLTNDYIRAAEDVLSWRVESVALGMLVACLCVLPLALGLWRAASALRRDA